MDRFILLGFKDNSIDYYKYFDIYAMTSYSEGFGLAMLESKFVQTFLCIKDILIIQMQPNNIESLTNAIYKVNENIDYYKNASYKLFEEKFSLDVMGNRHIELYKKVISDSKDKK